MKLTEYVDPFGIPLQENEEKPEDMKTFLPKDLIMIDCEMTGVVPGRDHLLQAAFVHIKNKNNLYEIEGEPLVLYLPYDGEPENEFQKKYLSKIFQKCNQSDLTNGEGKKQIEAFLGPLKGKVTPTGDCVPTDMAFLYQRDLINRPDIQDDKKIPGTFHYEYFDLNAPKAIARHKVKKKFDIPGLDENIHDALVDCYNQIKELNEYLKILL